MIKQNIRIYLLLMILLALLAFLGTSSKPVAKQAVANLVSEVSPTTSLLASLDLKTIKTIKRYIGDVAVTEEENTINHAIYLDHQIGRPAINHRNYPEAYQTYQKVLAISFNHGSLMGLGIGLNQMATLHSFMGNDEASKELEFIAFEIAEAIDNPYETGVVAMRIARALHADDRKSAIRWRLKAKKLLENTPYRQDYVNLLHYLAEDYRYIGNDEKALSLLKVAYEESLKLNFGRNDLHIKYSIITSYVKSLYWQGKYVEVVDLVNQLLPEHGQDFSINSSRLSMMAFKAYSFDEQGLKDKANAQYLENYFYLNVLRDSKSGVQQRAKFDKNQTWLINASIEGLIKNNQSKAALAILESNKARTLNEILGDDSVKQQQARWNDLNKRQSLEYYQAFTGLNFLHYFLNHNRFVERLKQVQQKFDQEKLTLQVSQNHKTVLNNKMLTESDIEHVQHQLDDKTVVISYFVSNETVYASKVTASKLEFYNLELSPAVLKGNIKTIQLSMLNPDNDYYKEPSQYLYNRLIKPLNLQNGDKIILIPDGELSVIPLGILHDGTTFLEQKFTVKRYPSLRFFEPSEEQAIHTVTYGIACIDPNLEGYRLPPQAETGHFLKGLYKQNLTLLDGQACTISNLEKEINKSPKNSFLHIGAHGRFYNENPMESGIALSYENSTSNFWDAQKMVLTDFNNISLVTLSSCESGRIDMKTPRDTFGIIRALYFGGAKDIIAPLWAVQQISTSLFMQRFYQNYSNTGSVSEALNNAKNAFINDQEYEHPFYWAAFINVGGPKQ